MVQRILSFLFHHHFVLFFAHKSREDSRLLSQRLLFAIKSRISFGNLLQLQLEQLLQLDLS